MVIAKAVGISADEMDPTLLNSISQVAEVLRTWFRDGDFKNRKVSMKGIGELEIVAGAFLVRIVQEGQDPAAILFTLEEESVVDLENTQIDLAHLSDSIVESIREDFYEAGETAIYRTVNAN
ncbi:MAG: hypothetical protein KW806_02850 [Candidatus Yanofskybacteria bacterium]|nr:hypothetical protein [Candidatus Yanofskybacteria bacterium]